MHYTTSIRKKMNNLVKQIRARRLALLIDATQNPGSVTGIFAKEGNHIHVQYE